MFVNDKSVATMNETARRAYSAHIWGNPEDCPGCIYAKAVAKRQTALTGDNSEPSAAFIRKGSKHVCE